MSQLLIPNLSKFYTGDSLHSAIIKAYASFNTKPWENTLEVLNALHTSASKHHITSEPLVHTLYLIAEFDLQTSLAELRYVDLIETRKTAYFALREAIAAEIIYMIEPICDLLWELRADEYFPSAVSGAELIAEFPTIISRAYQHSAFAELIGMANQVNDSDDREEGILAIAMAKIIGFTGLGLTNQAKTLLNQLAGNDETMVFYHNLCLAQLTETRERDEHLRAARQSRQRVDDIYEYVAIQIHLAAGRFKSVTIALTKWKHSPDWNMARTACIYQLHHLQANAAKEVLLNAVEGNHPHCFAYLQNLQWDE